MQNYPNPFNPTTEIAYELKADQPVNLQIFNAKGQLVKTLVDEVQTAGTKTVTWNGTDDNGNSVTSGVYFYKMKSSTFESARKMILMK
jgi:flagellar hook assembly protein FlgD